MKRLTYFDGGKWRLKIGDTEYSGEAVDRLAAYEDTSLEPEEIEQLKGEVYGLKVDKQDLEQYRAIVPIDRLAAYEDTGLEPEEIGLLEKQRNLYVDACGELPLKRIRELAQADREGRCVVLPFKPPRWVYMCSARFPKPAQAHYASAINVLSDMDKGCVFGDTPEEAQAALRREQDEA